MSNFYYATCGTRRSFLKTYTQYALRSLFNSGVSPEDVYCIVGSSSEEKFIRSLVPNLLHVSVVEEKIDHCIWKYASGIRKYSLFKAGGLHKTFPEAKPDRCLVYFDGDVIWYSDPTPFLESKSEKTWFHHGKDLGKRSKIKRKNVNINDYKSLSQWISAPCARLMVEHKAKVLPQREVVAGFYLLCPKDHALLKTTYEFTKENARRFRHHEGGGDQKPLNAALAVLEIDWHGGSRFFCLEHEKYFRHFFGSKSLKKQFNADIKKLGL